MGAKLFIWIPLYAKRRCPKNPDRLLFMFDERIQIFLKSDSFYLYTFRQNTKNGGESIEKDRNSA